VIDFRTWLRDRGYRDVPLYITEYGTLFPYWPFTADPYYDELGQEITEARSVTFMTKTFDVLRTAADASVGYPPTIIVWCSAGCGTASTIHRNLAEHCSIH